MTTGQLSSPSGGLCNTVCNLIAVTVQCTGKESSQHGRHLCICYEQLLLAGSLIQGVKGESETGIFISIYYHGADWQGWRSSNTMEELRQRFCHDLVLPSEHHSLIEKSLKIKTEKHCLNECLEFKTLCHSLNPALVEHVLHITKAWHTSCIGREIVMEKLTEASFSDLQQRMEGRKGNHIFLQYVFLLTIYVSYKKLV